jgi:polyketide biosynthesis enoyl-CoA hydratase PksI
MGQVVTISEPLKGVVQVTMEDRTFRNTFSKEMVAGIVEAFEKIRTDPNFKVVVLTGYENYFCCGGTKEELLAIYNNETSFNDFDFFRLPLECEIPVISAMQGHGIGGGLVFGLYADFSILGKENIYACNFMKYGFTPGMGGTLIVPLRMGDVIGTEMLYSAENYRGGELKDRGIPLKVVPKSEVVKEALLLAGILADKPRSSLKALKKHLTTSIKEKLPGVVEEELRMHNLTFHSPEVAKKIELLFGK